MNKNKSSKRKPCINYPQNHKLNENFNPNFSYSPYYDPYSNDQFKIQPSQMIRYSPNNNKSSQKTKKVQKKTNSNILAKKPTIQKDQHLFNHPPTKRKREEFFQQNSDSISQEYEDGFDSESDDFDNIEVIDERQNVPFTRYLPEDENEFRGYEDEFSGDSEIQQFSDEGDEQNFEQEDDQFQQHYQQDDQQDSIFRFPKKKKYPEPELDPQYFMGLNCYTQMTAEQKKKYFKEINKTYKQSLQIQEQYKLLAKKSREKFQANHNLKSQKKQTKSVSFSDKLISKTFSRETAPQQIHQVPQRQERLIKKIWQYSQ